MDKPSEQPAGRFQYSLKGLLLFTTWFAMLCAAAKMNWGVGFLVLFVSLVALSISWWRLLIYAWSAAAALFLLWLLLPAVNPSRVGVPRNPCANNLKQIAIALEHYEIQCKKFPPAFIADKAGKPMHSWRVLILPYIECQDLYKQYRFDEPWDGPNNRKLADKCPKIFICPADKAAGSAPGNTSYVAIVGPHAAWTGEKGVTSADFRDQKSQTLRLVEIANSGINWLEPRDLYVGQMARTMNAKAGQGISSRHREGAHAAFADGCVRFLRKDLPSQTLEALLTRDGGEDVDPNQ